MVTKELDNETALFQQVAAGDGDAFGQIFHHYNALLLPFVIKLAGSPDTAREIIQDLFTDVWQQREKLTAITNYRAWMYRLASNKTISFLRKKAAEGRLFNRLQAIPTALPESPDITLLGKEMTTLLNQAIAALSPAQQQVYRLSREQHLSIPEIADVQGVSPNTVKNQLVAALKAIRLFLERSSHLLFPLILLFS